MKADQVAQLVLDAVVRSGRVSDRTAQAEDYRIGASDVGVCRSYLWRIVRQEPRADRDDVPWKAFIGTWLGEGLETVLSQAHPTVHVQDEVVAELPSGRTIPGHVDVWTEPGEDSPGSVWDFKSVDDNLLKARGEVDRGHAYQIALYHQGLVQAGKIEPSAPAYVVYVDRSGKRTDPVVREVAVDAEMVAEIDSWVEDVVYGVVNDEEPSRDRPYEWCQVACPFFAACRGAETLAEGLLTDPAALGALEAYQEGKRMEKEGKALREAATTALVGVSGSNGQVMVSWTHVGASEVSYTRSGYDRINVRQIGRAK